MMQQSVASGIVGAATGILLATALPVCAADGAADSLVVDLPDIVVNAAAEAARTDRTVLDEARISIQDPVSLADLGVLLPSSRVSTNSRGDAHLMVRGAPERHVQSFLDGIPLNLPWDERADLEMIPTVGVGRVEGRRGPAGLLDGPGAIAGSVRLLPPSLGGLARRTRVGAAVGGDGHGRAELAHQQDVGDWNLMGAGSWRRRDGYDLPAGGGPRRNSDLEQYALLLRGARPVRDTGRLSLLAGGWTGEKGVPPELHLGDEARFWRYPVRERLLVGAALDLPLDAAGGWDLGAALSADFHHQEIDPRGPDRWDAPQVTGEAYEKDWDRTGYGRLRLTRWLGDYASVACQGAARYTHHRESTLVGGPVLAYSQWLASLALTSEVMVAERWTLRGGVGLDHASTPESGDKPANEALARGTGNLRATYDLGGTSGLYGAVSTRSRFPSLRESYSGALGRFVPNPDLGPERQDQAELGLTTGGGRWRLEAAGFVGVLRDGIERVSVGGGRFMRVNRSRIPTGGLELIGTWRPRAELDLQLQHTILASEVEEDDGTTRPAEDRPLYQSLLGASWQPALSGPGGLLEARVIGPRWSADATVPGGMRQLPAGVTWHARASWRWSGVTGSTTDVEAYLRVDNLFDQWVDYQTGLPAPGRLFSGGVALTL